jgi:hypothetical protein
MFRIAVLFITTFTWSMFFIESPLETGFLTFFLLFLPIVIFHYILCQTKPFYVYNYYIKKGLYNTVFFFILLMRKGQCHGLFLNYH